MVSEGGGGEVVFQPWTKILPSTISQQKVWRNNKMIFGGEALLRQDVREQDLVSWSAGQLVFGLGCKSGGGGGAAWVQDQCSGLFALPQW